MTKITKRFVEGLARGGSDTGYFDDVLQGFGVRSRTSGRRTYFVRHRTRNGQRRVTIGLHGPWTAETARVAFRFSHNSRYFKSLAVPPQTFENVRRWNRTKLTATTPPHKM